jgi:hypothetical protein
MGRLYLLARAYRNLPVLPERVQQDVRALLGWTVNQEELVTSSSGVQDDWLVLASLTSQDEKTGLLAREDWLWGRTSRRPALILSFAPRGQPLDSSLAPGLVLCGEMVYFPGAYPIRAVVKEKHAAYSTFVPSGYHNLSDFYNEYAAALGNNPWLEVFPAVLEEVVPQRAEPAWLLRDQQNKAVTLAAQFTARWELLALSGGHPLVVFGLWDGFSFLPLSAWAVQRYVNLNPVNLSVP